MPFSLTPEQKQSTFWLALWCAVALLLYVLGPILSPFIAAAILAYMLGGAVDRLARGHRGRTRMPRVLAVSIVLSAFCAAVVALFLIVLPVLRAEIPLLQAKIPAFFTWLDTYLAPWLGSYGIHVKLDSAGLRALLEQQVAAGGDDMWTSVLAQVRVGGSALLGWIATLTLVPVVLFYLLLDWHALLARIEGAIPRRWSRQTVGMAVEADVLLAQYLRGQLLVMIVLAVYYSTALYFIGLDVALPVGVLTGLLGFVPYLGFGLGMLLALVAALLQFSSWAALAWVVAIYTAGQLIESFILTPRLVGERIGLHPLAVIFSLMAFGELFGFAGLLLALPASAVLMVGFRHVRRHYLRSSFYNAGSMQPSLVHSPDTDVSRVKATP
ncbi:AI-2E family transporter [Massilia sp. H6]|uniref:AI-2E family transporter n=1 Tax=Massilia sp. H6 TaxID=2970464 RepID=UPI00216968CE|nr:AI-2E family transporter [Massilia sp. H6]UVW28391.1 AI-2E family transporter [Massilia sp. H6]